MLQNKPPEYYNGDRSLPIFMRIKPNKKRLFTYEDVVMAILWSNLSKKHVCSRVPVAISHNVSFLVDTSKLGDSQDVLSDDMGSWKNNRVDNIVVKVQKTNEEVKSVEKVKGSVVPTSGGSNRYYTLKRVYRTLNIDSTLKKIIATVSGMSLSKQYTILLYSCSISIVS